MNLTDLKRWQACSKSNLSSRRTLAKVYDKTRLIIRVVLRDGASARRATAIALETKQSSARWTIAGNQDGKSVVPIAVKERDVYLEFVPARFAHLLSFIRISSFFSLFLNEDLLAL